MSLEKFKALNTVYSSWSSNMSRKRFSLPASTSAAKNLSQWDNFAIHLSVICDKSERALCRSSGNVGFISFRWNHRRFYEISCLGTTCHTCDKLSSFRWLPTCFLPSNPISSEALVDDVLIPVSSIQFRWEESILNLSKTSFELVKNLLTLVLLKAWLDSFVNSGCRKARQGFRYLTDPSSAIRLPKLWLMSFRLANS